MSTEVEGSHLFDLYRHTHQEIRSFKLALLAACAGSQFESDKEHVDVTTITDTLCKLKSNPSVLSLKV